MANNDWKQFAGAFIFMVLVTTLPLDLIAVFFGYMLPSHGWIALPITATIWVLRNGGPLLTIPIVVLVTAPWCYLGYWLAG